MILKTHQELAEHIAGKRVLHLNSLGKDSVLTLTWLARYAHCETVSVFFKSPVPHPADEFYLRYLKSQFPTVHFIQKPNVLEINSILRGDYQNPLVQNHLHNTLEYGEMEWPKQIREIKTEYQCEWICWGHSKYEGFARASLFHRQGLMKEDKIYPLGLMSKKQVYALLKTSGIRLHPLYRDARSTYDFPSYYKMRSAFERYPNYEKEMMRYFPLILLDRFRWEELFDGKIDRRRENPARGRKREAKRREAPSQNQTPA